MIRVARSEDLGIMLHMAKSMVEESVLAKIGFDAQTAAETLAHRIISENGLALLAESNGAPAGMFVAYVGPYTFSKALIASDDAWYVLPRYRGSRVALELLRGFFDWAKDKGALEACVGISSGVNPERTARFLRRVGMTKTGEIFKKEVG